MIDFHTHDRIDSPPVAYDSLFGKLESYGELYQNQNGPVIVSAALGVYYPWINGTLTTNLYLVPNASSILTRYKSFEITKKITQVEGWYEVFFSASFTDDTASNVQWAIFVNGLKIPWITGSVVTNGADLFHVSSSGFVELRENDIIDLRVTSSVPGDQIEPVHVNFHLKRIAKIRTLS